MDKLKDFDEFLNSASTQYVIKALAGNGANEVLKIIREKWKECKPDFRGKTYTLDESECNKLSEWFKDVKCDTGAIGVGPSITFTPTSVGTIVEAEFNGESIILRELS